MCYICHATYQLIDSHPELRVTFKKTTVSNIQIRCKQVTYCNKGREKYRFFSATFEKYSLVRCGTVFLPCDDTSLTLGVFFSSGKVRVLIGGKGCDTISQIHPRHFYRRVRRCVHTTERDHHHYSPLHVWKSFTISARRDKIEKKSEKSIFITKPYIRIWSSNIGQRKQCSTLQW